MTYRLLLILPIIAVLLGVIPTAILAQTNNQQQQQTPPFITYTNSTYGISIKYPSTWVKQESHNQTDPGHIVKFSSAAGTPPAELNIIGGTPAPDPLQDYVDVSINGLRQSFNNFNLITSNSTSLAGLPAHDLVYTPTQTGHDLKFMQIFTIKDSKDFVITFGTLSTAFSNYLPTIQKMINSFEFVPTTNAQSQASNTSLVCNSAVCDNSQFNQFGFDYDVNPLNIHIHKHSGVWHNERGVFVPWSVLCNQGQGYLVQSCSDLIDSSGTLTQAGDRAVGCITNGAIITIAANTFHLPLDLVKSALGAIAPMTGCDGIVNLNTIQTGPQVQSLLTTLSNAVK